MKNKDSKKIIVIGAGYVGLSLAALFSKSNEVIIEEINLEKIKQINNRISPIKDFYIEKYFKEEKLNLIAIEDASNHYKDADYIIIAVPTNYDELTHNFNTKEVENCLDKIFKVSKLAKVVIKSTVSVGFSQNMNKKYNTNLIMFSPEFLKEGSALEDNLNPSRIIVGSTNEAREFASDFASLLANSSLKKDTPILLTNTSEAEAIKLFANTYLASRISFFNELDTYAELKGLNSKDIIDGVCLDPRIGSFYNNPSFGYGGYCLPKDTKQLLANYDDIPQNLMRAIVESNETRQSFIANRILSIIENSGDFSKDKFIVGIFRLTMKKDSDNLRKSAILEIIKNLKEKGINVVIYEPIISEKIFMDCDVINDLENFKEKSNLIITNRMSSELKDVIKKVYTRDIFNKD